MSTAVDAYSCQRPDVETDRPYSGGGGIRTHGTRVTGTTVFETARFNHSRTPPDAAHDRVAAASLAGQLDTVCFNPYVLRFLTLAAVAFVLGLILPAARPSTRG